MQLQWRHQRIFLGCDGVWSRLFVLLFWRSALVAAFCSSGNFFVFFSSDVTWNSCFCYLKPKFAFHRILKKSLAWVKCESVTFLVLLYSVYEPNLFTKEPYFLRLTYLSFKTVICVYWFIFSLMKNKGGRSHTSSSLHRRGSLLHHLSVFYHFPLHLKALCACYAGSLLQGEIALPDLRLERKSCAPPPKFHIAASNAMTAVVPLVVCDRGKKSSCCLCFVQHLVLTRPGHVSTALVQAINSANCILLGKRGILQSWLAGQGKAWLCEVPRNSETILGTISTAFCGIGSFFFNLVWAPGTHHLWPGRSCFVLACTQFVLCAVSETGAFLSLGKGIPK